MWPGEGTISAAASYTIKYLWAISVAQKLFYELVKDPFLIKENKFVLTLLSYLLILEASPSRPEFPLYYHHYMSIKH